MTMMAGPDTLRHAIAEMKVPGVGNMLNAYILIQTDMGGAAVVAELARAIPGVLETATVTGSYDAIARAQAYDMDELTKRVTLQIQALRGVMRTATCIVVQPPFTSATAKLLPGAVGQVAPSRSLRSTHRPGQGAPNGPISQLISTGLSAGEMAGRR